MNHKLKVCNSDIQYLQYKNMERGFMHFSHSQDMLQYVYLKEGNLAGVEIASKMFSAEKQGHLSNDPIRNLKYLFVINTGIASRFAVEGGIPLEEAYAISDLYIQKVDLLHSVEDITVLQKEMFTRYTNQVALHKKSKVFSKPIVKCKEYIATHLNEPIHLTDLAAYVNLNANYLSTLFKKETMESINSYITKARIEEAKTLLKHSEDSYAQISSTLAFSSQSYFTKIFREQTGYTPKKYRMLFYGQSITPE